MRRLVLTVYGGGAPARQMGIDEAMALYAGLKGVALARIYWFKPTSVTIGYFQSLREAVNLEEAEKLGVPVVRRLSGGGSVLHDEEGEVTYSVAVPAEWLRGVGVEESFRLLASWVACTAQHVTGRRASFEGLNDIVIDGRKVSGNAQFRRYNAILQHGTLLYATRLDLMKRILRVPPGKERRIESRVATLSGIAGRRVRREEVVEALMECADILAEALKARLVVEAHLPGIVVEAGEGFEWRYASREWLWRRP